MFTKYTSIENSYRTEFLNRIKAHDDAFVKLQDIGFLGANLGKLMAPVVERGATVLTKTSIYIGC